MDTKPGERERRPDRPRQGENKGYRAGQGKGQRPVQGRGQGQGQGQGNGGPRKEGHGHDQRAGGGNEHRNRDNRDRPQQGYVKGQGRDQPRTFTTQSKPQRQTADPDSPFAKLSALKAELEKRSQGSS